MSKRRSTFEHRCQRCFVNLNLCFCKDIESISTRTKVSFIMHVKELALTSNTAKVCTEALDNAQYFIRGSRSAKDFSKIYSPSLTHYQLYLYPTDDSLPLTNDLISNIDKPIELVVPDASWNQAKKFHQREEVFKEMQKVHLINQKKSIYTLRTQKYDSGVCTLEAVAYALEIIEGSDVKEHLLRILKVMNIQNLKARMRLKHE